MYFFHSFNVLRDEAESNTFSSYPLIFFFSPMRWLTQTLRRPAAPKLSRQCEMMLLRCAATGREFTEATLCPPLWIMSYLVVMIPTWRDAAGEQVKPAFQTSKKSSSDCRPFQWRARRDDAVEERVLGFQQNKWILFFIQALSERGGKCSSLSLLTTHTSQPPECQIK